MKVKDLKEILEVLIEDGKEDYDFLIYEFNDNFIIVFEGYLGVYLNDRR